MMKNIYIFFFFFALAFQTQMVLAAKVDISPLPFVYLNQYFNFQISNDHALKIGENQIDFDEFKIAYQGTQTILDIRNVKNLSAGNAFFVLKSKDPRFKGARLELVKDKLQYDFATPFDISFICLTQSSPFTTMEICKGLPGFTAPPSPDFKPVVKIDGVEFDGSGVVVLKDNLKNITFEAQISEFNLLRMITKKRKVYPRRIQKAADQDFLLIQFVDVNLAKGNSWNAKLNVDQTYFEIPLDPLVQLRQDIFYKNENVKSSEINYVYAEIKKPVARVVYYNDFTAELFSVHIGLGGQSASLKASLISDLGKGLRFSSKQRINPKIDALYAASFGQINFASDAVNPIFNSNQSLFTLSGGVSYHLKSKFEVSAKFEIRKDLFFRRHDSTTNSLDLVSGLDKEISVAPTWSFFETTHSQAKFQFGFGYLLGTTAESETINSGLGYKVGFDYIYNLPFGNIKGATYYYKRQQNSDNFTFNEQSAFYSLGYQYLF